MFEGILTAVFTLFVVILILYLTYVVTKFIARGHVARGNARYMKLCDQMMVGQDKSVAVVQVGDRYFLVGIAANQINLLTELEEEGLIQLAPDTPAVPYGAAYFKDIMDKVGDKIKKK